VRDQAQKSQTSKSDVRNKAIDAIKTRERVAAVDKIKSVKDLDSFYNGGFKW